VDAIPVNGFHFDNGGECGLGGGWSVGHDEAGLGSIGMMEGTQVILAEPGVLEGVGAVDLMSVGKEEPEVTEGLIWDELELGKSVLVGGWSPKVSDEGSVGCLG
jgi:hypothetical protein